MINRGRESRYAQWELDRGLSLLMLDSYFSRKGMEWQIRDDMPNMIKFHEINLGGPWLGFSDNGSGVHPECPDVSPYGGKKRHFSPYSWHSRATWDLILGATETTLGIDDHFERVVVNGTSVYRIKKNVRERIDSFLCPDSLSCII
jgi:chemotaxis protein methyltransferase CheR